MEFLPHYHDISPRFGHHHLPRVHLHSTSVAHSYDNLPSSNHPCSHRSYLNRCARNNTCFRKAFPHRILLASSNQLHSSSLLPKCFFGRGFASSEVPVFLEGL